MSRLVLLAAALAATASAAAAVQPAAEPPQDREVEDSRFAEAQECRSHLDTWSYLYPNDERPRRIVQYWIDRSVELGAAAGLTAQTVEFRSLVIPRDPPDLEQRIARCLELTLRRLRRGS